jgi:hypothetical protein
MAARKDYTAKKNAAPIEGNEERQELTVDGKPIPDHLKHVIAYDLTDQGKAEASAKLKASGRYTENRVTVASSEFDKQLLRYEDDANGSEPWEQANPIDAAIARVPDGAGKAFHLFGNATYDRDGARGFVPEKDAEGNLIKVGNMVLASMPEARAAKREQHYKNLALDAEKAEGERYREEQAKNASEGITPLRPGESVQGNAAFNGLDEPTTVGHTRQVGNSGAILAGV